MSSFKLANYLRTHRKRLGLSQDEVTFLLGRQSTALVSVHEQFCRLPCLGILLAYTVILQSPAIGSRRTNSRLAGRGGGARP